MKACKILNRMGDNKNIKIFDTTQPICLLFSLSKFLSINFRSVPVTVDVGLSSGVLCIIINCIKFNYSNFSDHAFSIDVGLLTEVVTKTRCCELVGGGAGQLQAILEAVMESEDLALTELRLQGDITQVSAGVLAGAVSRLEEFVLLSESDITRDQLHSIFTLKESSLKLLHLEDIDLSAFSPELLLGALRMLETFVIYGPTFTADQVKAILDMLAEGSQGSLNYLGIFYPYEGTETYELLKTAKTSEHAKDILKIDLDP